MHGWSKDGPKLYQFHKDSLWTGFTIMVPKLGSNGHYMDRICKGHLRNPECTRMVWKLCSLEWSLDQSYRI